MTSRNVFKIRHPAPILVAGPSFSGKSTLVRKILKYHHECFIGLPTPVKVLWCFGQKQDVEKNKLLPSIKVDYHEGLPDEEKLLSFAPNIVIIDDLQREATNDKGIEEFFTKRSHHEEITVILIVQNIFTRGKSMRDISLNSRFIYLTKNPRDSSQIVSLARQIYPARPKFLVDAYLDAVKSPYSYIRIDMSQETPNHLRVATRLFPDEVPENKKQYSVAPVVYEPK